VKRPLSQIQRSCNEVRGSRGTSIPSSNTSTSLDTESKLQSQPLSTLSLPFNSAATKRWQIHTMSTDEFPPPLAADFRWSQRGEKHVKYEYGERFEGKVTTFDDKHVLGHGGQGYVVPVICKEVTLARKLARKKEWDRECEREATILEDIVHRHIVQLAGTYTEEGRFYILIYPVAQRNLKEFMGQPHHERDLKWETRLKHTFGCLAAALEYLHGKDVAIKHKDIKPSNVLMFNGVPMLTDFGFANSFKGKDSDLSKGPSGKSPPYAAPEVIADGTRDKLQDIFSLGLVFQDIFWALHGAIANSPRDSNGRHRDDSYRGSDLTDSEIEFRNDMVQLTFKWSDILKKELSLLTLIRIMTATYSQDRPEASHVRAMLMAPSYFGRVCGDCCHDRLDDYNTVIQETTWTGFSMLGTYSGMAASIDARGDSSTEKTDLSTVEVLRNLDLDRVETKRATNPSIAINVELSSYEQFLSDHGVDLRRGYNWSGRGKHLEELGSSNEIPLQSSAVIGYSANALVEAVHCGRVALTRKSMNVIGASSAQIIKEIRDTSRLPDHGHVVQLVGSYVYGRSLCLLTFPVANMDLLDFMSGGLESVDRDQRRWTRTALDKFLGCLAKALESVHDRDMVHGDLRPTNIMVEIKPGDSSASNAATVYLTGFGATHSRTHLDTTVTMIRPERMLTYAAPEAHIFFGSPTTEMDIFSMGCVFLQIKCVILGFPLHRLYSSFNLDAMNDKMDTIEAGSRYITVDGMRYTMGYVKNHIGTIRSMLKEDPTERINAGDVARQFPACQRCFEEHELSEDAFSLEEATSKMSKLAEMGLLE
jgi:serine/threonine protein kinase